MTLREYQERNKWELPNNQHFIIKVNGERATERTQIGIGDKVELITTFTVHKCGQPIRKDDGTCGADAIYHVFCGLIEGHTDECIEESVVNQVEANYQKVMKI